jgi:hypothetical protein
MNEVSIMRRPKAEARFFGGCKSPQGFYISPDLKKYMKKFIFLGISFRFLKEPEST